MHAWSICCFCDTRVCPYKIVVDLVRKSCRMLYMDSTILEQVNAIRARVGLPPITAKQWETFANRAAARSLKIRN